MDSDDRGWIARTWDAVADFCIRAYNHMEKKCEGKLVSCLIVFGSFGLLIIVIIFCGCLIYGYKIDWLWQFIVSQYFRRRPSPSVEYHAVQREEMASHDSGTDQAFYDPSNLLQMPVENRRRPRGVRIRSDESGVDMISPAASEPPPDPEVDSLA